jgi:hypothetical protein
LPDQAVARTAQHIVVYNLYPTNNQGNATGISPSHISYSCDIGAIASNAQRNPQLRTA